MKLLNSAVLSFGIAIICGATSTNGILAEFISAIKIMKEIQEFVNSFEGPDKTTLVPLENLQNLISEKMAFQWS